MNSGQLVNARKLTWCVENAYGMWLEFSFLVTAVGREAKQGWVDGDSSAVPQKQWC